MSDTAASESVRPEQVDALINKIGNKTERRVNALRWTGERSVDYDSDTATWSVLSETIGGWDFRTFTELRRAGAITVSARESGSDRHSTVELSAVGKALLDRWLD